MTTPVQNPPTPHLQPIPGGFFPGCIAHVTGTYTPGAASLIVKLQSGPSGEPNDEIGLCVYGRVMEAQMGRNCFTRTGGWGQEELTPGVGGLAPGVAFDLTIMCDPQHFKIAYNGRHICEFTHRVNPSTLTYLQVGSLPGDLSLSCVWIEQQQQQAMQQQQVMQQQQPSYAAGAPPAYAAPSYGGGGRGGGGGGGYGAPYDPNPQPGYAPPPGMAQPQMYPGAPPQQQYPPQQYSSQQHGKEKGLAGMIGGAAAGVAGALGASHLLGKATKVLGGSSGHHGGPAYGSPNPPYYGGGGGGGSYPTGGGSYPTGGGSYPTGGGAW